MRKMMMKISSNETNDEKISSHYDDISRTTSVAFFVADFSISSYNILFIIL